MKIHFALFLATSASVARGLAIPDDMSSDDLDIPGGKIYHNQCVPGENDFPGQLGIGSQVGCFEFCKNEPTCSTADWFQNHCYPSKKGIEGSNAYPNCDMWVKDTDIPGGKVYLDQCVPGYNDFPGQLGIGSKHACYEFCKNVPECHTADWLNDLCYPSKKGIEASTDYPHCDMWVKDTSPVASASGDPHFVTFGGHKYDFHGGCDMVLVSHPNFANGLGFEVHIRTKISSWWSHIDSAVIKLGGHTLEIKAGEVEIPYWLNGVETSNMETGNANLGDHAIHFRRINDHQTQTRISLGGTDAVGIETWKKFLRVNMKVADPKKFIGAVGMLGSYPEGKMLGRDGVTIMEEPNEFGFEWQVKATEAQLFHNDGPVSFPTKCSMPSDTKSASRRLGEVMMTEDDAATACARVDEASRDACIFDVMATNDKDMAGSY